MLKLRFLRRCVDSVDVGSLDGVAALLTFRFSAAETGFCALVFSILTTAVQIPLFTCLHKPRRCKEDKN